MDANDVLDCPPPDDEPSAADDQQVVLDTESSFSLRTVLAMTTIAAALFAVGRLMPRDLFAGALGLMALVGLMVISFFRVTNVAVALGWWLLLAAYIIAAVVATTQSR